MDLGRVINLKLGLFLKKKKTVVGFEQVSPWLVLAAGLASDPSPQFLLFSFLLSLMKEFFSLIKISKNISDLGFMWQIQNI